MKYILLGGALALIGSYPTFIERNIVHINHYRIPVPDLPHSTQTFISRGIGWALYPVRFNCPPEIALLELVRAGRGPQNSFAA